MSKIEEASWVLEYTGCRSLMVNGMHFSYNLRHFAMHVVSSQSLVQLNIQLF